jgi:hypothetical protein
MGGKGGGGGDYYAQPPDTSGYGTPEEAKATLAKTAPLDMSNYQQTINVKKAAADATAKERLAQSTAPPATNIDTDTGDVLAKSIVQPPVYWEDQEKKAAERPSILAPPPGVQA